MKEGNERLGGESRGKKRKFPSLIWRNNENVNNEPGEREGERTGGGP